MSLVTLTELPFRKVVQKGVTTYVSDVGSVRLVVTDVSILSTDPVTYIDLLTGISYQYEYGLKLPAKINITPVAGVADSYNVNTDNKSVLMCGRLFSKTPSSTGSILGVNPDAHVSSSKNIIFKFNQQLAHAIGTVSKLEGVIVVDTFIGEVPEAFTDTVLSTITDMYNTIIPEVSPLVCGVIAVSSPYDSFVAGSDAEMYALVIKQGDRCLRTDLDASYINITGSNHSASDWETLGGGGSGSGGIDQLTVQSLINTAVLPANTHSAITVGNPHHVTKADVGLSNVPNTDFTAAVAASTAVQHSHSNKSILDATDMSFTASQAAAIVANTAKVGITQAQADAIVANTAKVGITAGQTSDIVAANTHRAAITGNVHQVTKAEVGLGSVPNTDFTNDVTLNTANRHNHANKTILDATTASFTTTISAAIDTNTAKVGITTAQANAIVANTAKVGITTQQTDDIVSANTHRAAVTGNVHNVTKAEVGLNNVPNVDCTNASNITTGTLPSSVLPALAITDTFVVASQTAQLALTVQKGDIAVRTDLSKSFINTTNNNTAMSDWQELMTPLNTILSVNGQTGTVVLSTTNIIEGTNLYYTEARVNANTNVAANTAARHTHANKASLDLVSGTNTGDQLNITGNAGSANKLATSRTINSVAFDGTANIIIPVGTGDVTLGGIQTLTNKTLEAVTLTKSLTEAISAMADSILTATNGTILTKALAANTVFTDGLAAGQSIVLTLTNASTYTVTWPTISWVSADGNVAPLLSANNVFVFWKIGTTLYGTLTGSF